MASLPIDDYAPPRRSRTAGTAHWRAVYADFLADERLEALEDFQRRSMDDALRATHRSRDYATGLIDAPRESIAKKGNMGVTRLKAGHGLLCRFGYLEVIPRRRWDPEAQPAGWKGRGKWLQATNGYELKRPRDARRWPQFAPADAVEFVSHHSAVGERPPPSNPVELDSSSDSVGLRVQGYPQAVEKVDNPEVSPGTHRFAPVDDDPRPVSLEERAAQVAAMLLSEQDRRNDNHWRIGRRTLE